MKKVLGAIFALYLLSLLTGCATAVAYLPDGTRVTKKVPMPLGGVIPSIQNNCSAILVVQRGSVPLSFIPYGESSTLPTRSEGRDHQDFEFTLKAYTAMRREYLGSYTLRLSADSYSGREKREIPIDRLDSPPGAKCVKP